MLCPQCAKEIPTNIRFCGYCGASLKTIREVKSEPAPETDLYEEKFDSSKYTGKEKIFPGWVWFAMLAILSLEGIMLFIMCI